MPFVKQYYVYLVFFFTHLLQFPALSSVLVGEAWHHTVFCGWVGGKVPPVASGNFCLSDGNKWHNYIPHISTMTTQRTGKPQAEIRLPIFTALRWLNKISRACPLHTWLAFSKCHWRKIVMLYKYMEKMKRSLHWIPSKSSWLFHQILCMFWTFPELKH